MPTGPEVFPSKLLGAVFEQSRRDTFGSGVLTGMKRDSERQV